MSPIIIRKFAAYHGIELSGHEQNAFEQIRAKVHPCSGLSGRDRVVAAMALCEVAEDLLAHARKRWFGGAYSDAARGVLVQAGIEPDRWLAL